MRSLSVQTRYAILAAFLIIVVGCGQEADEKMGELESPLSTSEEIAPDVSNFSYSEQTGSTAEQEYRLQEEEIAKQQVELAAIQSKPDPYSFGAQVDTLELHTGGAPEFRRQPLDVRGEGYSKIIENGYVHVAENPRSTFSIDVDTASYANVRRFLESGQLPPSDAIRLEELINYFPYDDPAPLDGRPFSITTQVAKCPWDSNKKLVRIGLKGQEVEATERQPANLVFLVDVSGSMRADNKLPLVKRSLHRLLEELDQKDHISIVTYASGVRTVLPPTPANQQHRISQVIDSLHAGGSTNGSAGLQMAYQVAQQKFVKFGTNRVILCSDGDFNVGITDENQLVQLISNAAKTRVFLSVLGFGTGNYQDSIAEKLADHGNGNYAYIDSYSEARKVLVEQMTGTLETIAKDVKIQVEFNPSNVAAYRLIGYENRKLNARDFRDDRKDAGEIGAGHSVTALYEVVSPSGDVESTTGLPKLRYQQTQSDDEERLSDELLTVRVRYKRPAEDQGQEFAHVVQNANQDFSQAGIDFRFATAVAVFGMILRDSDFASEITWGDVRQWAATSIGPDPKGYRTEFLNLLSLAESVVDRPSTTSRDWPVTDHHHHQMDSHTTGKNVGNPNRAVLSGLLIDLQSLVTLGIVIAVAVMISYLRNPRSSL